MTLRAPIAAVLLFGVAGICGAEEAFFSTSTAADRSDLAVTAYNNGVGVVRETRKVTLPTGEARLRFQDVAEQIRPETVRLRSLQASDSVTVLEQNYEYDLLSPRKLLEKYVGKQIRLLNFDTKTSTGTVDATLLSVAGGPVYQVGGEVYLGHPGTVVLPEIPPNLVARPSLLWTLENTAPEQELEVTYQTGGLSWEADYVVTLPRDEAALEIGGWVTLTNQSGAAYTNARLKLVAGDVHLAPEPIIDFYGHDALIGNGAFGGAMPLPEEEDFGEYHLYTMPRRTTLKQNQSKQLALLQATDVMFQKKYEYQGRDNYYLDHNPRIEEEHVAVSLLFRNEEANGMGLPLPAGSMRVYREDGDGLLQYVATAPIEHTPTDEEVTLAIGGSVDIIADTVQKSLRILGPDQTESAWEVRVRNVGAEDVVVDVVMPIPGEWEILESSQDFQKRDAATAVFPLPVAGGQEAMVDYRVRIRH
jgi:hypothetical protein